MQECEGKLFSDYGEVLEAVGRTIYVVSLLIDFDGLLEVGGDLAQNAVFVRLLRDEVVTVVEHDVRHSEEARRLPEICIVVQVVLAGNFLIEMQGLFELLISVVDTRGELKLCSLLLQDRDGVQFAEVGLQ